MPIKAQKATGSDEIRIKWDKEKLQKRKTLSKALGMMK